MSSDTQHRRDKCRHPKYKFRHPKCKFRHPKFENLILSGSITQNNNHFEIIYSNKNKGEIVFFFDLMSFDLEKWEIVNLLLIVSDFYHRKYILKNEVFLKKRGFLTPFFFNCIKR